MPRRILLLLLLMLLLCPWASGKPIPIFTPVIPATPTPTPSPTPEPPPDPPVGGFEVREQFGKVCRIPTHQLPWEVYSPDARFQPALVHAVNSWNEAGRKLGMGLIYEIAPTLEVADLVIDWNGQGLEPQRASAVWWEANLGRLDVTGLSMDGRMNIPMGNFAQLLMHEMGHPLGLGHSDDPNDIMYATMHTRRYTRVDQPRLTGRDQSALAWLYRQKRFVPIRGRRARAGV